MAPFQFSISAWFFMRVSTLSLLCEPFGERSTLAPMATRRALALLPFLFLVACRENAPATTDAGAAATVTPSAEPTSSASAASNRDAAAAPDASPLTRADEARRIVRAWNDALVKHDVDALTPLYAPRVKFYTSEMSRAAVLGAKRRALGPTSTFRQEIISELELLPSGDGVTVSFNKRSGPAGKSADVRATLVLSGNPMAIREERDAASDARLAPSDLDDRCSNVVTKTVQAMPAVKKVLAGAEAELPKYPDRRMGGMGPVREADGQLTGGLGVHSDERYEALVWYSVSPNGVLEVTAPSASPNPLPIAPADAARISATCKRP
jgi:hypothetical protein